MKIKPLGDKIVLKQLEAQETTKSGLVLTSFSKEKPSEAIVVAVGSGNTDVKIILKEKDHVIFSRYGAIEIKFEDEEYLIMRQDDILAIIEEE